MGIELLPGYLFQYWSSEKCGVYIIYGTDSYGNRVLIYVGQSENLLERFQNHHKQACFNQYIDREIYVYKESNESNRLIIESKILSQVRPPCND